MSLGPLDFCPKIRTELVGDIAVGPIDIVCCPDGDQISDVA